MRGALRHGLASLALAIGLTACGSERARTFGPEDQNVRVAVDDTFVLELPSNITTGYSWQMAAAPDAAIVQLVDEEYVGPASDAVGAGGEQRFTMHATGAGSTSIMLRYVRPWEQPPQPTDEITFAVVVEP